MMLAATRKDPAGRDRSISHRSSQAGVATNAIDASGSGIIGINTNHTLGHQVITAPTTSFGTRSNTHSRWSGSLRKIAKLQFDFPYKIHLMLEDAALEGNESLVSWLPSGKSFRIHNRKGFERHILPRYFSSTKTKSFLRQLNIYCFERIKDKRSVDCGAYWHKLFVRGKPSLCSGMVRQRIKHDDRLAVLRGYIMSNTCWTLPTAKSNNDKVQQTMEEKTSITCTNSKSTDALLREDIATTSMLLPEATAASASEEVHATAGQRNMIRCGGEHDCSNTKISFETSSNTMTQDCLQQTRNLSALSSSLSDDIMGSSFTLTKNNHRKNGEEGQGCFQEENVLVSTTTTPASNFNMVALQLHQNMSTIAEEKWEQKERPPADDTTAFLPQSFFCTCVTSSSAVGCISCLHGDKQQYKNNEKVLEACLKSNFIGRTKEGNNRPSESALDPSTSVLVASSKKSETNAAGLYDGSLPVQEGQIQGSLHGVEYLLLAIQQQSTPNSKQKLMDRTIQMVDHYSGGNQAETLLNLQQGNTTLAAKMTLPNFPIQTTKNIEHPEQEEAAEEVELDLSDFEGKSFYLC